MCFVPELLLCSTYFTLYYMYVEQSMSVLRTYSVHNICTTRGDRRKDQLVNHSLWWSFPHLTQGHKSQTLQRRRGPSDSVVDNGLSCFNINVVVDPRHWHELRPLSDAALSHTAYTVDMGFFYTSPCVARAGESETIMLNEPRKTEDPQVREKEERARSRRELATFA